MLLPFLEPGYLFTLFLVFVRIGGFMVAAPIFGHQAVPARVRVLMAALLAFTLAELVPGQLPQMVEHPVGFILAVAIEAITGALLGYGAQFVFWTVQVAGEIVGFQMGLSIAAAFNPIDGLHSNPVGRLLVMTLLLVFLLLDGHHQLLRGLVGSFDAVPLAGADLSRGGPLMLGWIGELFSTAIRLASPFMITIFLVDIVLGVFARVAPQADLFAMAFPLKLILGLLLLVLYVQNFMPVIPMLIDTTTTRMADLIEAIAH